MSAPEDKNGSTTKPATASTAVSTAPESEHSGLPVSQPIWPKQLLRETRAMVRYAMANGLDTPAALFKDLSDIESAQSPLTSDNIHTLADIHRQLSRICSPATPLAISLLHEDPRKQSPLDFLGSVPLVRRLSLLALLFLSVLLGVSLSGHVNVDTINLGLLDSEGEVLLFNQIFLIACAGLGASFASLFQANKYVTQVNFDPRYESTYWARIILGLISGIILVELIPDGVFGQGSVANFSRPTLAMFGGFSATVVYRILQRLVDTLDTAVKGRGATEATQTATVNSARASEQRTAVQSEVASTLVNLARDLEGKDSKAAADRINDLASRLLAASNAGNR
ncbi:MAG: hypothetical protein ACPGUC_00345 [Gammaproteobacteria bacterium]